MGRGGTGDDLIRGKKGRDRLYGNRGRDTLRGGSSADRIFGGKGRDRLFGNSGDDLLRGNGGADRLSGGSGSDRCFGGSGSDSGSSCESRSSLTPPAPTPKPVGFSPGTYLVGPSTLPSGRYSATAESGCYWERLSGLSGESSDRISNDFLSFGGPLIVDIDPTDVAFTFRSKCGNFSSYSSPASVAPSIAPGAHVVGADISVGLYRGDALDGCYWERLRAFGGTSGDRITNDRYSSPGQVVVRIESGDTGFYVNDKCGTLVPYVAPAAPASSFGPGMHVVGTDISPGLYTAQAQSSCYWERVSGFNGSSGDRIANDFISSAGQVIVEISAGDAGFFADGECGTWTR